MSNNDNTKQQDSAPLFEKHVAILVELADSALGAIEIRRAMYISQTCDFANAMETLAELGVYYEDGEPEDDGE